MLFEEHNAEAVAVTSKPHCADMGCDSDLPAFVSKPHCIETGCDDGHDPR